MFTTSALYKMIAPNGMLLENGVNPNLTRAYGIVIREDTVIAAWLDSNGNNLLTAFGIAGMTLRVTDPALIIPENRFNYSITLASGSIWLLL